MQSCFIYEYILRIYKNFYFSVTKEYLVLHPRKFVFTIPLFENVHSFLCHMSINEDFVTFGKARFRLLRSKDDKTFRHLM